MAANIYEMLESKAGSLSQNLESFGYKGSAGRDNYRKAVEGVRRLLANEVQSPSNVGFLKATEALNTPDASIVLRHAISEILLMPVEPAYIGLNLLAKRISSPDVVTWKIPAFGAVRAQRLSSGQSYPEVPPSFHEYQMSIELEKHGVMVAITDEMIRDSKWALMGMLLEAGRNALYRLAEQEIFELLEDNAHIVFDNAGAATDTTGIGANGSANNTLSLFDIFTMMAAILDNEYTPEYIVTNTLGWVMFARHMALWDMARYAGNVQGIPLLPANQSNFASNLPFGLTPVLTPFVTHSGRTTPGTTPYTTTVFVGDSSNQILFIETDGGPSLEEWRDPSRDIENAKLRYYWGTGILDQARGWACAKNVAIDFEFGPLQLVKTIS